MKLEIGKQYRTYGGGVVRIVDIDPLGGGLKYPVTAAVESPSEGTDDRIGARISYTLGGVFYLGSMTVPAAMDIESRVGPTDTFRNDYVDHDADVREMMALIKAQAQRLEAVIIGAGSGRELALALTKLEECVMWAVKGVTAPKEGE